MGEQCLSPSLQGRCVAWHLTIPVTATEQAHYLWVVGGFEVGVLNQPRAQCIAAQGMLANQLLEPFTFTDIQIQGGAFAVRHGL
ncbi:hypothetical protein D9M73_268840 [compost metagenome]